MTTRSIRSRGGAFQTLDALKRNRRKRARQDRLFVESVRAIELALDNDWRFDELLIDETRTPSTWAEGIIRRADCPLTLVASELMAELSDREDPSELIAIVKRRDVDPGDLVMSRFVVVVDRPASEGNLGSLVRAADAFGVDAILTTGHGVDIHDPKTIRASIVTVFCRPIVHCEGPALSRFIDGWRAAHDRATVVATSARGEPLETLDLAGADAHLVLVGNERRGLAAGLMDRADVVASIPMEGSASSLNVVAATAVVLYEVRRSRSA